MSRHYRDQVGELIAALNDEARRSETTALIRTLVDRIVLRPENGQNGMRLAIDLEGDLAGILTLASKGKTPSGQGVKSQLIDSVEEIKLVAGAGFEPATFRL